MKILLKNIKIVEKGNNLNAKIQDILIVNGIIEKIAKEIKSEKGFQVFEGKNLSISQGWFDMNVNFCDPGEEQKEDLNSGVKAAAAGGFTGVGLMPECIPTLHSKSQIEYIKNKNQGNIVEIFPIGAVTKNREGKELAELFDMKLSGAVAFSDGSKSIQDSGMLSRAILYAKGIQAKILCQCEDKSLAGNGMMNEGIYSTELGMQGIPSLAEELMVNRVIGLAEYHDAEVHIVNVSSKKSVQLIKEAKTKGLKITCDVAINHLVLNDEALQGFDSNLKLNPPLRTHEDQKALIKGVLDGTIDVICSQHRPQDKETKEVEFEIASFGMIGIQTLFSNLLEAFTKAKLEDIIEKISTKPRDILNMEISNIEIGAKANLTIFDEECVWEFNKKTNYSKSENSIFLNKKFKGKAKGIIRNNQFIQLN